MQKTGPTRGGEPGSWFFAGLALTAGLSFAALKIAGSVIHPEDVESIGERIGLWGPIAAQLKPEPVETLVFLIAVALGGVLMWSAAWASTRSRRAPWVTLAVRAAAIVGVLGSLCWLLQIEWDTILPPSPGVLIAAARTRAGHFAAYGLVAAAIAAAFSWGGKGPRERVAAVVLAAIPIVLLAPVTLIGNGEDYTGETHYEVFSYPIIQDWLNQGIYLGQDGQKSQYGMYPVFLRPIWRLFGGPSSSAISAAMTALLLFSQIAMAGFMARFANRPALGAVCAVAAVLVAQLLYPFWPGDAYFEFFPVRTVFPGLAMALLSWRVTRERYPLASIVLLAFGLLWNFESGLVGLAMFVTFRIALAFTPSWPAFVGLVLRHAAMTVLGVLAAGLALTGYYLVRFHAGPDLPSLLLSIKAFSSGAGAEPMPPFAAWGVHAFIYLLSAFVGLRALWRNEGLDDRRRTAALLAMTAAGVLWLRYYQGRSLPLPLSLVSAPAVCCVGLLVDRTIARFRREAVVSGLAAALVAAIFVGSLGAWISSNPLPGRSLAALKTGNPGSALNASVARAVAAFDAVRRKPDDELLVIAPYAALVSLHLGRASPIKAAGMCQIWFQSEIDNATAALQRPETKMVILDPSGGCMISGVDDQAFMRALRASFTQQRSKADCDVPPDPAAPRIFVREDFNRSSALGTELARGRPAAQSSLFGNSDAGRAVDGDTCGGFNAGSIAHTNQSKSPWWQVDLGASKVINAVELWNRTDCCGFRLNNSWVFVSDTPFRADDTPASLRSRPDVFSTRIEAAPAPNMMLPVRRPGRYVRVQLEGEEFLALAEVRVFGQPAAAAVTPR